MYNGYNTTGIEVIDLKNDKEIDLIKIPKGTDEPYSYSWRNDSSYVIFSFGNKQIVKYTLPKEYWDNPANNAEADKQELSEKLRLEGFALYQRHKDAEAVKKYEEALKQSESAQLYYDYGNSLSNLKDRLEDSIKAYQKALELGYSQSNLVHYNIACVYSRTGKISEAYGALQKALDAGYKQVEYFEKDSDLANLRKDSGWARLV